MADENERHDEPTGGETEGDGAIDWKAEARKWESRSKANAEKARAYDELQEQSKTELQKATDRAARAEAELKGLKHRAELDAARSKVSSETGVPADLISGADEAEMRERAKAIADYAKPSPAPRPPVTGAFDRGGGTDADEAKRRLARLMFGDQAQ